MPVIANQEKSEPTTALCLFVARAARVLVHTCPPAVRAASRAPRAPPRPPSRGMADASAADAEDSADAGGAGGGGAGGGGDVSKNEQKRRLKLAAKEKAAVEKAAEKAAKAAAAPPKAAAAGGEAAAPAPERFTVLLADCHPCDASHRGDSDDIAQMNDMHEGPLLALLDRRFLRDAIYTFTGDILISLNPYKGIPGLYDIPAEEYAERKVPHVFSMAEVAYKLMLEETNPQRRNQSMIVSGESGAGKTENCKHVMRYLATLSARYVERTAGRASLGAQSIEKKVLDCNPFLEAFGNAKTVRNDNSSRFGKFLKIEYDGGRILGARIRHYLLEKARVVYPNPGERNYHIFYQLARGATGPERAALELGPVEDFAYLTSGGVPSTFVDGVDDAAEFNDARTALTDVGVALDVQLNIFRVVAGVMHLGNIKFRDTGPDGSDAVITNPASAEAAARLLGASRLPEKLVRRLISVKGRNSSYEVNLNAKQGAVARDSLAKTVYERLFSWLIARTNRILSSRQPASAFVGILDIFGFEIFELNSFEQMCINYANEKLQNLFNHHIFVMEMEQYAAEGVDVSAIAFINNQACVDLLEKKPHGLLPMLDEICFLGRETTDLEYLEKIEKAHKGKNVRGQARPSAYHLPACARACPLTRSLASPIVHTHADPARPPAAFLRQPEEAARVGRPLQRPALRGRGELLRRGLHRQEQRHALHGPRAAHGRLLAAARRRDVRRRGPRRRRGGAGRGGGRLDAGRLG